MEPVASGPAAPLREVDMVVQTRAQGMVLKRNSSM
ncbi:hypothetical protein MTBUT4_150074 [Magnetospirillum sp. UT-4]|nr:hypothetical protein MTBUT4_150074 [Magnetospirillum sp. UT-4]